MNQRRFAIALPILILLSFGNLIFAATSNTVSLTAISIQLSNGPYYTGNNVLISGYTTDNGAADPNQQIYLWVDDIDQGAVTSNTLGYYSYVYKIATPGNYIVSMSQLSSGEGAISPQLKFDAVTPATTSTSSTSTSTSTSSSSTSSTSSSTTKSSTSSTTSSASTTVKSSTSTSSTTSSSSSTSIATTTVLGIKIDGSASCNGGRSCNMTLSTTNPDDVIIVETACSSGSGCPLDTKPYDTAGLAYSLRKIANNDNSPAVREDYAIASSKLTNDIITCATGNPSGRISCTTFAISGASLIEPFDIDAGIPCNSTGTSGSATCTLTTKSTNEIIIGLSSSGGVPSNGIGYTIIKNNGGDTDGAAFSEYKLSSGPVTIPVSVTMGASAGEWAMIGDVLTSNSTQTTSTSTSTTTTIPPTISHLDNVTTYGTGLSGAPVIMDGGTLGAIAGGDSVQDFDNAIKEYFQPLGIKLVFLDMGWENDANTSTTKVAGGYEQWVTNWLNASEQNNIQNLFFVKQFGYFFSSPSWDQDFLNQYPGAATVNSSGVNVPFPAGCAGCTSSSGWTIASPFVYKQYEEDLKQLYAWYGNYTSWIGFGEGATGDKNNYADSTPEIKTVRPFDNNTISMFAHSSYFLDNINFATGNYIGTNVPSDIYATYFEEDGISATSGGYPFVYPESISIYGNSTLAERFYVPFNTLLYGFTLKAWVNESSSATGTLYATIYTDSNENATGQSGKPAKVMEKEIVNGVGANAGWVSTTFNSTLEGGDYYWVVYSSPSSSKSNSYTFEVEGQDLIPSIYTNINYEGSYLGSILWVQSKSGEDVSIYPYLTQGPNFRMTDDSINFVVQQETRANMVAFFDSDRAYDPNNVSFWVEYQNGTKLASAHFSIAENQGNPGGYFPVQFNKTIILYPNVTYKFQFGPIAAGGISQDVITDEVNPSSAGYLGQSIYPIFYIGLMNVEGKASNLEYSPTDLQASPGESDGFELAMRFMPNQTENLLKFEVEAIGVPENDTGTFNVSLRVDNETGSSHPASLSSHAALATAKVSIAAIKANLTSNPSAIDGKEEWVNVTFPSNTALTANTYYWLVMNSSNYVQLLRLVNPYKADVLESLNDQVWGVPGDGPTDLGFDIVMSKGNFSNLYEYAYSYTLSNTINVAQSFSSQNSFQMEGVWLDNYADVEIESNTGNSMPSGKVLATGSIPTELDNQKEMYYYSLNVPINISANTKYWIVMSNGSGYTYVNVYRKDGISEEYGDGALHYEYSSNGGNTWYVPNNIVGDVSFLLAGTNSTIHVYNTSTISNEIIAQDDPGSDSQAGWNNFLDSLQTNLMYNLTQFMSGYSGRQFEWYTGLDASSDSITNMNYNYVLTGDAGEGGPIDCSPTNSACGGFATYWTGAAEDDVVAILSSSNQNSVVPWASFGTTSDNAGDVTVNDLLSNYLIGMPLTARNPTTFNDWSWGGLLGLNNMTETSVPRAFGTLLNRMQYNGGYYGTQKNTVKVLWIGGSGDGIFPELLTSTFNVTEVSSSGDQNLTSLGNLEQFDVIVGSLSNPTNSFIQRENAFIVNGGGYVSTGFGGGPNEISPILGLYTTSNAIGPTSTLKILKSNPITAPYNSISFYPYWIKYQILPLANESANILVTDSKGNPVITVNNYGSGRTVLLQAETSRYSYMNYSDSWTDLLINSIFYAAHKQNELPVIWDNKYQLQSWNASVEYSIDGTPGKPVLLWLSNDEPVQEPFAINLNASFYGINPNDWKVLDVANMSIIAEGTGNDIYISTQVPAYDWEPLYLLNQPSSNLGMLYTTASISNMTLLQGSAIYSVLGSLNTSEWLVINSTTQVTNVWSGTNAMQQYTSMRALNSSQIGDTCISINSNNDCTSWSSESQQGWYYNAVQGVLYVHYMGAGPETPLKLTILQNGGSTSTTTTTINETAGGVGGVGNGSGSSSSGSGSTGGGVGGGGGGIHKPTITQISNGYIISSIAQLDTFDVTLCGMNMQSTENFITPEYGGISINGNPYTLYPNESYVIPETQDCYVSLLNVSYLPLEQTISIKIYNQTLPNARPIQLNTTEQNFTSTQNISSSMPLGINLTRMRTLAVFTTSSPVPKSSYITVSNVTAYSPLPPENYAKILALRINSTPVLEVNLTIDYNCSIDSNTLSMFELESNKWATLSNYTVDPNDCDVSFSILGDPVVSLMNKVANSSTVNSTPTTVYTTVQTTIAQSTSGSNPVTNSDVGLYLLGLLATGIVVTLAWYIVKETKPPGDVPPVHGSPEWSPVMEEKVAMPTTETPHVSIVPPQGDTNNETGNGNIDANNETNPVKPVENPTVPTVDPVKPGTPESTPDANTMPQQ